VLTDSVMRDLATFGPFFAVQTHPAGSTPREPWHAMNELVEDPGVLMDRVAAVRCRLAAAGGQPTDGVEMRVAASVTHLGLVARLVSPALAVAVTSGELLEIDDLIRRAKEVGRELQNRIESLKFLKPYRKIGGDPSRN